MANAPRKPETQTAAELTAFAGELEYIARIYRDAVDAMKEAGISEIEVSALPTRARGLNHVRGSLRFIQNATNELRIAALRAKASQADSADPKGLRFVQKTRKKQPQD